MIVLSNMQWFEGDIKIIIMSAIYFFSLIMKMMYKYGFRNYFYKNRL